MDKINELIETITVYIEDFINKIKIIFDQIQDMINPQPLD